MAVLLSVWRCQETWESKIVRAFSLREKDRMRGLENQSVSFSNPLTPTLSLRERGLSGTVVKKYQLFILVFPMVNYLF